MCLRRQMFVKVNYSYSLDATRFHFRINNKQHICFYFNDSGRSFRLPVKKIKIPDIFQQSWNGWVKPYYCSRINHLNMDFCLFRQWPLITELVALMELRRISIWKASAWWLELIVFHKIFRQCSYYICIKC